jgi:hypothetical protein
MEVIHSFSSGRQGSPRGERTRLHTRWQGALFSDLAGSTGRSVALAALLAPSPAPPDLPPDSPAPPALPPVSPAPPDLPGSAARPALPASTDCRAFGRQHDLTVRRTLDTHADNHRVQMKPFVNHLTMLSYVDPARRTLRTPVDQGSSVWEPRPVFRRLSFRGAKSVDLCTERLPSTMPKPSQETAL